MIHAKMDWKKLELKMWGHAGHAEKGKDIVCAGASILFDALGAALAEAQERGRTKHRFYDLGGTAFIHAADPGLQSIGEIKAYYRMAVKGLRMLAEQYPKNVELKEVS